MPGTLRAWTGGAVSTSGGRRRRRPSARRCRYHRALPPWGSIAFPSEGRRSSNSRAARAQSAPSATSRCCQPGELVRLPSPWWLSGSPAGGLDRSGRRAARITRLQVVGTWWSRLSFGSQVGCSGEKSGTSPLHPLQRRRVRARHVQRSCADGRGSVRDYRSDDHRRIRHGRRAGVHLHPCGISAGDQTARTRDFHRQAGRFPGRRRDGIGLSLRNRGAPRSGRIHLRRRDRLVQLDRGIPWRAEK